MPRPDFTSVERGKVLALCKPLGKLLTCLTAGAER
jgi:hypothetical protein